MIKSYRLNPNASGRIDAVKYNGTNAQDICDWVSRKFSSNHPVIHAKYEGNELILESSRSNYGITARVGSVVCKYFETGDVFVCDEDYFYSCYK